MKTIDLRISDNVLDKAQWPIVRCTIEDSERLAGRIVSRTVVHAGVYALDGFPRQGATAREIAKWLRFDATGSHPETYHEVLDASGRWRSFLSTEEMNALIERAGG